MTANPATPTPPTEPTPFDKFRDMTRKLMAVPKAEIAAEEKKYQRVSPARNRGSWNHPCPCDRA